MIILALFLRWPPLAVSVM